MAKRFQLGPEIERYTQLLARDSDSLAFVPLADAYRKSGLFEEAFAVLKRGMTRRPDYIPAKIVLGKCYLDLGNFPKAETTFDEILEVDRDNLVALSAMANVRLHQRRYGEAATTYRRILELDSSNAAAAQQLAKLEGKGLSQTEDEVVEIDIESSAEGAPTTDAASEGEEETIDFEEMMRSEEPPPERLKKPAPTADIEEAEKPVEEEDTGTQGRTARKDAAPNGGQLPADESAELNLDGVPAGDALDVVDGEPEERRTEVTPDAVERPDAPIDELKEEEEVPPVKQTGEEPEIDADVQVPPPPATEELELVKPEYVEVMPEDEVPPEIPPVKDTTPMVTAEETEKPAFRTFSSWLSGLAGRKNKKGRQEDKDEESNSG